MGCCGTKFRRSAAPDPSPLLDAAHDDYEGAAAAAAAAAQAISIKLNEAVGKAQAQRGSPVNSAEAIGTGSAGIGTEFASQLAGTPVVSNDAGVESIVDQPANPHQDSIPELTPPLPVVTQEASAPFQAATKATPAETRSVEQPAAAPGTTAQAHGQATQPPTNSQGYKKRGGKRKGKGGRR